MKSQKWKDRRYLFKNVTNQTKHTKKAEKHITNNIWLLFKQTQSLGVGIIFSSERPLVDFCNFFVDAGQSWQHFFFLLQTKKTTFFAEIFKTQGSLPPPFRRPWTQHYYNMEKEASKLQSPKIKWTKWEVTSRTTSRRGHRRCSPQPDLKRCWHDISLVLFMP